MPRISKRPMKRWTCLSAVGLVLLLTGGVAQSKPNNKGMPRSERHESRQEILQLEQKWKDAVLERNVPAMEGLLGDDYIGITPNGTLESKEQTLANMKSRVVSLSSIEISDRKIRFYGKTAVVTSKAEVSGDMEGSKANGNYRYTRVYVRDPRGGWKIVSFEASRIRQTGGAK
jgi:ketosteroid isomerase-like protein